MKICRILTSFLSVILIRSERRVYRYYTRTYCEETGKAVTDGVVTVYLNTRGEKKKGFHPSLWNF